MDGAKNGRKCTRGLPSALSQLRPMVRLAGQRGIDRRGNPIDRIGLLDHRSVVELGWRWVDVAAGRDDERDFALAQRRGDRPYILALEIHIEDGEVESALFGLVERAFDRVASSRDGM